MNKKSAIVLFTLVSVFFATIAGIIVTQFIYANLTSSLIDDYGKKELVVAKQTAAILESEVTGIEEKLKIIALIPEIRNGSSAICNKKLQELVTESSLVSNIGRVDANKQFHCTLNTALQNTDASKLGAYINQIFADPEHKPVLSRIIRLPNGSYAVALHIPVFDENNKFIGTLGGAIYFDQLRDKFLKNVQLSGQSYIALIDNNGDVLYHPDKTRINTNNWPKTSQGIATASAITKGVMQSAKSGSSGVAKYIFQRKEKIAAYASANVFPGRRWEIIVTTPIEDAQSWIIISGIQQAFVGFSGIVALAAIIPPLIILFYLISTVFQPLEKIAQAASKIGDGNLDVEVPGNSHDEIGKLAQAFNEMRIKLKTSYQNLEQKVKDRTAELESAKAKDDVILKGIGDGVFAIDTNEKIILFNPVASQLSGFSLEEAMGKNYGDILKFTPENEETVKNDFIRKALHGEKAEMGNHTVIVRKDGQKIPVADSAAPVFDSAGNVTGAVVVFRDVTKAREIDRMKTEFISIASHQLRTPLTAMKWLVDLLKGDLGQSLSDEQKNMVKNIGDSNERMIDLVNALLNVSRIESGRFIIEPVPTNIAELVQNVVKDVEIKAREKKQELKISVDDKLPQVLLDPKLIRQVYINLLTNAIKYTPEGGKISVTVLQKDNDLLSQITDTGYGIPKKDVTHMFEKFYRADNIVKQDTNGNGLGLYFVKSIIDSSGGKIWFESEENKGTTFWFTIPLSGMKAKKGEVTLGS